MTKTKSSALSWTPIRKGGVYCSPACGSGCTWAAYKLAEKRAKALCVKLGPGWEPRVWENMGWHAAAISKSGRWKVHFNAYRGKLDGYTAFLGQAGSPGGEWAVSAKKPKKAIKRVLAAAKAELDRVVAIVEEAERDLK